MTILTDNIRLQPEFRAECYLALIASRDNLHNACRPFVLSEQ